MNAKNDREICIYGTVIAVLAAVLEVMVQEALLARLLVLLIIGVAGFRIIYLNMKAP